jgi:hypothetical protein
MGASRVSGHSDQWNEEITGSSEGKWVKLVGNFGSAEAYKVMTEAIVGIS